MNRRKFLKALCLASMVYPLAKVFHMEQSGPGPDA